MIPQYILQLEKMPLTSNGKIDRRALPEPDENNLISNEYQPPRNETEEIIVEIWQDVLGIKKIGINDNFFEIGGNSINIIKIANQIEKRLKTKFPISHLYLNNTVKDLGESIHQDTLLGELECVVKLNNSISNKNLFIFHGYDGDIFYYKDLAKLLEEEYTVYGIQSKGIVKDAKLPESLDEMLENYLNEIKMVQGEGPYLIAGYCVGVLLAYEMTRKLEDAGEEIEKLLLIDGNVFVSHLHLKLLDYKEKLSKGGFINQLAGGMLDRYFDLVHHIKHKKKMGKGKNSTEERNQGRSEIMHNPIEENIELLITGDYVTRSKLKTHTGVIKAKENNDPTISKELWEKMINAPVDFDESPGNHETMLLEPNVGRLAEVVGGMLRDDEVKEGNE